MSWYPFENGKSIGQRGSENGVVLRDDEHGDGARVTLERDGHIAPYSISCGIYGWTVHTRFFSTELEAQSEFQSMRDEITKILGTIPLKTDPEVNAKSRIVAQSISEFVERFP